MNKQTKLLAVAGIIIILILLGITIWSLQKNKQTKIQMEEMEEMINFEKEQLEEEQEQEGYVCNKNLQNGIAVGICILIIICLIIGINFKLI